MFKFVAMSISCAVFVGMEWLIQWLEPSQNPDHAAIAVLTGAVAWLYVDNLTKN